MRKILLLSSSRLYGFKYLEHAREDINALLKPNNISKILFIPYALKDYDKYTEIVRGALSEWGYEVEGIHSKDNLVKAVQDSEAIFIGGGNTFVLLKALYENNLVGVIREEVLNRSLPYIGSSAGTNVATRSIHTTNDMPVMYPPTFDAIKLVPFNINPHYIEPDPDTKHKGKTRDKRIAEYIKYNNVPVLGLPEGTALYIKDKIITLKGKFAAKLFRCDLTSEMYPTGSDLSFLFTSHLS